MRQVSWNEMFAPRGDQLPSTPPVPQEPAGWRRLLWWEDLLTFALLAIMMLAVAGSVQRAGWVDDMPSLYPVSFLGLLMGAALSRLRWPEGFIHLIALPVGAAIALGQILTVLPGGTPWARYNELQDRMHEWFRVAFNGGISNDDLPFTVLVVSLSWLAGYVAAWAIFRWRNVWLALVPGGGLLLMNISYQAGQFSFAFLVFMLGAVLLVTRLHLMERAQRWREDATPYPEFLSLSVMHATFWLALLLLTVAWLMPRASEAKALDSLWQRAATPVSERLGGLGRLFVGIDGGKSGQVHSFQDFLPFVGSIELPNALALQVTTESLSEQAFLRARAYDIYTPRGWQLRSQQTTNLVAQVSTGVDDDLQDRLQVTIRLISSGRTGDTVFTVGQPRRLGLPVTVEWSRVRVDITSVEAKENLERGEVYQTVGSISIATDASLRAAGDAYPSWVELDYLQLPGDFPQSVVDLAAELTVGEDNAYDQAVALETYLRTIPFELDVPDTPRGRDTIEYFLFDLRRGYFDYHASAMVVMLRSLGVPSRLAVGYALRADQKSAATNEYNVAENSAFAWPEVYFPGFGWVEFSPTPGLPTISRGGTEADPLATGNEVPAPQPGLGLENLEEQFPDLGGGEEAVAGVSSSTNYGRWIVFGLGGTLAVVVVLATGGLTYAWMRGLGGLEPVDLRWGQTVRLASWARMPPAASHTPREFARELGARVPDLEDDIELLADAYVRHRYGREPIDEDEEGRLEQAWRAVRRRLLPRLFRSG